MLDGAALLPVVMATFLGGPFLPRGEQSHDGPEAGYVFHADQEPHLAATATMLLRSLLGGESSAAWSSVYPAERRAAMHYVALVIRQKEMLEDYGAARTDPSSVHSRLADGDRERLEAGLLFARSMRADLTISHWDGVAEGVGTSGHKWIWEDLEHAMWLRDRLARLFPLLSPAGQGVLREAVDPADEVFFARTTDLKVSLVPDPLLPAPWWWQRVPHNPSKSLRHALDRGPVRDLGRPPGLDPPLPY